MWPDLEKFRHLGKILKRVWPFLEWLFSIWQNWEHTLAIFYALGQIFVVLNGQMLKNNLAIWSHWPWLRQLRRLEGRNCLSAEWRDGEKLIEKNFKNKTYFSLDHRHWFILPPIILLTTALLLPAATKIIDARTIEQKRFIWGIWCLLLVNYMGHSWPLFCLLRFFSNSVKRSPLGSRRR